MDKTTRSIYIFHCIYLFYFWRNFLSRWKDEERRYCYRRIMKNRKSRRKMIIREIEGIRTRDFRIRRQRPKRSAIEDIPRCLYDIQFLSLFYRYSVLKIQFPYYEQFLNIIPLFFFIQYPFFIRDKLINNFLPLSQNSSCSI